MLDRMEGVYEFGPFRLETERGGFCGTGILSVCGRRSSILSPYLCPGPAIWLRETICLRPSGRTLSSKRITSHTT